VGYELFPNYVPLFPFTSKSGGHVSQLLWERRPCVVVVAVEVFVACVLNLVMLICYYLLCLLIAVLGRLFCFTYETYVTWPTTWRRVSGDDRQRI